MNIGQICSRDIVSAPASATLAEVARLMHDRHVGCVVIVRSPLESPVAIGMITDRDIVRAQLDHHADLSCLGAEQVMSRNPLILEDGLSIGDGIERLRSRGVRRAPVVTSHGLLAGVVSIDDLLAEVARELGSLVRLIEVQPNREPS